jgi:predicted enzyme related to lactoylglutathione lyase
MAELPPPPEGIVLAHFIVSDDVERSRRFYTEVLGGRVVFSGPGGLTYVALSNTWIIINVGGGPTDDKPAVSLEAPRDPDRVSSFLNIRVKDIQAVYAEWSARGADFLTPPKQHQYEIRCYISAIPTDTSSRWGKPRTQTGTGCPLTGHRVRPPRSPSECRDHRRDSSHRRWPVPVSPATLRGFWS